LKTPRAYLLKERPQVLPKSPIGEAIDYTLSNWEALVRYTEDGDLEIDNNGAERSLRPIVIGRNNWLFYGSDNGGRTGAVLSTLIATCKRLHIEPFTYLRDLFSRIGSCPQSQIAKFASRSLATGAAQTSVVGRAPTLILRPVLMCPPDA